MISDVLSDGVRELDRYLKDPKIGDIYSPEALAAARRVRDMMDGLRGALDNLATAPDDYTQAVEFVPTAAQIAWAMCWAAPAPVGLYCLQTDKDHTVTVEHGMSTEAFAMMVRGIVSCAQKPDADTLYRNADELLAKIEGTKGRPLFEKI